jgi:Raf kinase inhibitor-like YbhB/YbcL family protein
MEFKVCSSAFCDGEHLPLWYCGTGLNSSPPLGWDGEPAKTVSLAVICRSNEGKVHWVMWNIPNSLKTIYGKQLGNRKIGDGIQQGVNDYNAIGWTGPMVTSSSLILTFHLYAIDKTLDIPDPRVTADKLLTAIQGHVLKEALLSCACS